MDYEFILCSIIENSIWKISLNRPEVLNSLNRQMRLELISSFEYAKENSQIRAVLLTGEGRAFSAGQDLKEVLSVESSALNPREIVEKTYNPLIKSIRELEKPVLCMVNGIAAGAAANIAFACDIIVASKEASFIQSFSKIGLIPDSGGTYFLPRLIGLQRAAALMMTAEKISADEALQMGLIYKVSSSERLQTETMELLRNLSQMPTKALGLIKRALNKTFQNDLDAQLILEAEFQELAGKTGDYNEGINAFLEKRKPEFKGS